MVKITNELLLLGSPVHSNGGNCPPGAVNLELEICDHEVDSAFRGISSSSTAPNVMNAASSPTSSAARNSSTKEDEKPPFNSTHQVLGMYHPVPNKYGNGTQIYGTLGRQQRRHQRPLSGNSGSLQLNGRPRSQRLGSDCSTSIILNPSTGQPSLIESNSFPQGAHIISSHPMPGQQTSCVSYHPNNEWMMPSHPPYIGIHPPEGSISGSSMERGPVTSLMGGHNLQNEVIPSSCMNPELNGFNISNNPHIMSSQHYGGNQLLRGGSIPSASDTNYIPDLEDTSSVIGGGLAPLPMPPLSDQHLVRYSTIGRPHNRLQNQQLGNTVTSPRYARP